MVRTRGVAACWISADRYLTYCEAANYGDYEHGVFWFDLEPAAEMSAASADVLFLGDSRLQFAFSTAATAKWFSLASITYYLLGFAGSENSTFARALLHKLRPRAKVYVIGIDPFFEPSERPIAKPVLHDGAARARYETKKFLQIVHKIACMKITKICGNRWAIFRSRKTGAYYMPETIKFDGFERPVSYDAEIDGRVIHDAISIGQIFISELPVKGDCVILTVVPTVGTRVRIAEAIANGLGKTLVVPEYFNGLSTREGVHLDQVSAERWSEAFFKAAAPEIEKCT